MAKGDSERISRFERIKSMGFDDMVVFLLRIGGCATCSRRNLNDHCECAGTDECKEFIKRWLSAKVVDKGSVFLMRDRTQITFEELFGLKNE